MHYKVQAQCVQGQPTDLRSRRFVGIVGIIAVKVTVVEQIITDVVIVVIARRCL